jgi:hypothetical protein
VVARIRVETRKAAVAVLVETQIGAGEPPESRLREMFQALGDSARLESLVYETRAAAHAARQRIEQGATFAAEARGAVMAQTYARPDAAPPFMRGQLDPALGDLLFASPAGKLVGPVELKNGWGVARAIKLERGTDAEFAAARPGLAKRAKELGRDEAVKHVVAQLRAKSGVTLDEAFLRGLRGKEATPQQLEHVVATVNGQPMRYAEVFPFIVALDGHMAGPNVKIQFAWRRVDAILLEDLAIERHLDAAPEVKARQPEFERIALADGAARRICATTPPPGEDEIQDYYRRNARAFGRPFEAVLPQAVAGAREEKCAKAAGTRIAELRKKASISVDRAALGRAVASR